MTIENKAAFDASLWDWGILKGCFGDKISPTDVDGLVERKGYFLLLEAKKVGTPLKYAQELLHRRLREIQPPNRFTTVVIWGHPGSPVEMQVNGGQKKPITLGDFRDMCARWYTWADK
jgi:hypothetical protein